MPETQLINESLILMAIGMGIVFSFLLLLVVLLRAMSWVAARLGPALPEPSAAASAAAPLPEQGADEPLIAVIGAAIARYRADRQR
jgi:oxaloacetate decarboxylase gamma subunit